MPRPLRSSCDRCHSQKLKCPKQPGSPACTRCTKAGATCIFSPAAGSRRMLATPSYENDLPFSVPLEDIGMQFDWPPLDFNPPLHTPPEVTSGPEQAADQGEQNGEPAPAADDPRSICVRQLSTLALDFDRICVAASPQPQIHGARNRSIADIAAEFTNNDARKDALEGLFINAQRLLDIYPRSISLLHKPPEPEKECDDPNCMHRVEMSLELDALCQGAKCESLQIDLFIFNLILSCHSRLSELLGSLMSHVKICVKATLALPQPLEPELHIPQLRVGNFVASPESSSTMQVVLVLHLASALALRAKELRNKVVELSENETQGKQIQLLKLQCEVLIEEAESKIEGLNKIRDLLLAIGYLK